MPLASSRLRFTRAWIFAKWHAGAALLENFFVDYRGGVSNRPGTKWLGFSTNSSVPSRLIKFVFSTSQAYVLVFEHFKMRVIIDGAFVRAPGTSATSCSTRPTTRATWTSSSSRRAPT
jgi:ABC-type glycerol-3-phosphate transport system permease component